MKSLELKVPPPVVALCTALLMWLAASFTSPSPLPFVVRVIVGTMIALTGIGIGFAGMLAFQRANTTVNPFKPDTTSALVTQGIYRLTRNPMYLGLLLALVGWGAFLFRWPAFLVLPIFVLYIGRFQIAPEERVLTALFDGEYDAYRTRVRRWI